MADGFRRGSVACLVAVLVLGTLLGTAGVAGPAGAAAQSDGETITVDDDGDADFESIQAAIDSADPGDTVEVRPGTYEELLYINYTIDLVAPEGAVLNGSRFTKEEQNGITIEAGSDAAPLIKGFTIRNYWKAVLADRSEGDWVIEDVRMLNNVDEGIDTENTKGDWVIRDTVIRSNGGDGMDVDGTNMTSEWTLVNSSIVRNGDQAFDLDHTSNDWTIRNSVVRGNRNGAMQGTRTRGDWTIENTVFYNNSRFGLLIRGSTGNWTVTGSRFVHNSRGSIFAQNTSGDWVVRNTVVRNSTLGVNAGESTGDWRILDTRFEDLSEARGDFPAEGVAIYAPRTTGRWQVHGSSFRGFRHASIRARNADPPGDATGNYFDDRSPVDGSECTGNVDCGEALSSPPDVDPPPTLAPDLLGSSEGGPEGLLYGRSRTLLLFGAAVVLAGGLLVVANYRIRR